MWLQKYLALLLRNSQVLNLTTAMKSVGEVMAIGRTFQESFQKALTGLEVALMGLMKCPVT